MPHDTPGRGRMRSVWPSALAAAMALALGAAAAQAAPIAGLYKSDDMDGGVFLTGRWSEGFALTDPVGNGAHAGSWDGAALYTHWELVGPAVVSSAEYDLRTGGTGTVVLHRTFETPAAWLTLKAGLPWTGPGDGDYVVDLDAYSQTVTIYYQDYVPQFARSVESLAGSFVGHPAYRLTGQADGAYVGQGAGSPPAGFPAWVPATAGGGAWGEVGLVRFQIVPDAASLSLVGLGLAGVALRASRRRG